MSNTGCSTCIHCGAEYRLFSIMNRGCMQALTKIWKRRHERTCALRTPEQRRKWARPYAGKEYMDSSITVDLDHPGFKDT